VRYWQTRQSSSHFESVQLDPDVAAQQASPFFAPAEHEHAPFVHAEATLHEIDIALSEPAVPASAGSVVSEVQAARARARARAPNAEGTCFIRVPPYVWGQGRGYGANGERKKRRHPNPKDVLVAFAGVVRSETHATWRVEPHAFGTPTSAPISSRARTS